ncbi:flap endonuclease 1-like isoform X2 [Xenia sp. Carnegie-2017]|uniref:flap endonuclease 1-like isoform X2 n=1 Tax=Xenia sp. Carnegie-2017 TaxID=2897299 RepID=UPI001F03B8C5|nr:flap endonuclease 1-like isoform X2 [Xenia sp. Carnegie-2017]
MGIHGLTKLLGDCAPTCMKENEIKNYFGRKVAIDASMSIYQFLIAVRSDGSQLTNEAGEVTSYVFDGKPPKLKSGELAKRTERREQAQKDLQAAEEAGDAAMIDKSQRRLVKVTKQHNEECKSVLQLMGVPYLDAPCEAEAQCASLVANGKVYATATEDMDSLTFGSLITLRHMTFSEARKLPIQEFHLKKILEELGFTQDEFIDLCILLGCDYCDSIKGIGPKRAIELVRQHRSIEGILKHIDSKKYPIPEDWKYKEARALFKNPDVADPEKVELKWCDPDVDGLVHFLVKEKGFSEERIRSGISKLQKARKTSVQGRLDGFFKVLATTPNATNKRKADNKKTKGPAAKKAKSGKASKLNGNRRG